MLLIGVSTGLIACFVDVVIEKISFYKFHILVQRGWGMDGRWGERGERRRGG